MTALTNRCYSGHHETADIGGFRNKYLGRQVVSRLGGLRAGMGSAGHVGSAACSPSGVWGGAPVEIEFGAFSLKI